jgi:hypothetical protein
VRGDNNDYYAYCEHVTITGEVQGDVYLDANGNGKRDAGEKGVAGVWVWADQNGNKVLDDDDVLALTDDVGHYVMDDIAYGSTFTQRLYASSWKQTSNNGQPKQIYLPWNTLLGSQDVGVKA